MTEKHIAWKEAWINGLTGESDDRFQPSKKQDPVETLVKHRQEPNVSYAGSGQNQWMNTQNNKNHTHSNIRIFVDVKNVTIFVPKKSFNKMTFFTSYQHLIST